MQATYSEIYALVKRVPAGRVLSYGGIARRLGSPRAARVVGSGMRVCEDAGVPCHRVVHSDGRLAESFGPVGNTLQRALLLEEGVRFLPDGRVDMLSCEWREAPEGAPCVEHTEELEN